jgi:hypothetical protein
MQEFYRIGERQARFLEVALIGLYRYLFKKRKKSAQAKRNSNDANGKVGAGETSTSLTSIADVTPASSGELIL